MESSIPSRSLGRAGEQQLSKPVIYTQFDLCEIGVVNNPEEIVHSVAIRRKSAGKINGIALRLQIEIEMYMSGIHDAAIGVDHRQGVIPGTEMTDDVTAGIGGIVEPQPIRRTVALDGHRDTTAVQFRTNRIDDSI